MRLTDADNLNFQEQHYNKSQMKAILDFVDNQPTVYDIDRVAEQLKTDSSVRLYGSGNSNNYLIPLEKTIEIVKAGGNY
jgi:predicted KAP-like P-loop ATPase